LPPETLPPRRGGTAHYRDRVPELAAGDELFDCRPQEFVSARNALARRLRAEGEREAAATVTALRRPTPGAWALNQVARHEPELMAAVTGAAEALRQATERALNGDAGALRSAQQTERSAVGAVITAARQHLAETGQSSEAIVQRMLDTLRAAGVDEQVRAQLSVGHLTADCSAAGLGLDGLTLDGSTPRGASSIRSAPARREVPPAARRGPADAAARRAEREAARQADLDAKADGAEQKAERLEKEATEARRAAEHAASAASRSGREAERARQQAELARARADRHRAP
jgi:hypothetical protein